MRMHRPYSVAPNRLPAFLRRPCCPPLLAALLLPSFTLPAAAQYNFLTNNGTIAITRYTGSGGDVSVPATLNGLPVTSIEPSAFAYSYYLTSVTIPAGVTNIGTEAFRSCLRLTTATVPDSVASLGSHAFEGCSALTAFRLPASITSIPPYLFSDCAKLKTLTIPPSVTSLSDLALYNCTGLTEITVPDTVTTIGLFAFKYCGSLTRATIGNRVTSLGGQVFMRCSSLQAVYFRGPAPTVGVNAFYEANQATVYYLPRKAAWTSTFGGRPTALWKPVLLPGDPTFGTCSNQFGFNIAWTSGMTVVVEACSSAGAPWSPLSTNTLAGDSCYFTDAAWREAPARFFRVCFP